MTSNPSPKCELCGEPMPPGEEMFKFHGYSGDCPKPPLPKPGDAKPLPIEKAATDQRIARNIVSFVGEDQRLGRLTNRQLVDECSACEAADYQVVLEMMRRLDPEWSAQMRSTEDTSPSRIPSPAPAGAAALERPQAKVLAEYEYPSGVYYKKSEVDSAIAELRAESARLAAKVEELDEMLTAARRDAMRLAAKVGAVRKAIEKPCGPGFAEKVIGVADAVTEIAGILASDATPATTDAAKQLDYIREVYDPRWMDHHEDSCGLLRMTGSGCTCKAGELRKRMKEVFPASDATPAAAATKEKT